MAILTGILCSKRVHRRQRTAPVKEGDQVVAGQLVATIRIVPTIQNINAAQQEINNANLQISNSKMNLVFW